MLSVLTAHPDPRLQPFIRSYAEREAQLHDTQSVEPVVARLGSVLEFQFADAFDVQFYGSEFVIRSLPITVIGPITYRRARIRIRGHVHALSVFFAPFGLRALFGMPTAELIDIGTEGHALLGPDVSILNERLGNVATFEKRVQLLDQFFLKQATQSRLTLRATAHLSPLIATEAPITVTEAARQAGLSTRQLERLALEYAGIPPKFINRIARFERAMTLKVEGSASWTEIAHAANYHDQMHMIRDFRSLAGDTPARTYEQIRPEHLSRLALPYRCGRKV